MDWMHRHHVGGLGQVEPKEEKSDKAFRDRFSQVKEYKKDNFMTSHSADGQTVSNTLIDKEKRGNQLQEEG